MSFIQTAKFIFIITLSFAFAFLPASTIKSKIPEEYIHIEKTILKPGDIIFRKGLSFVSNMILLADAHSEFSHAGLIFNDGKNIFVIHTTPDESDDGIDKVKIDSLQDFLRTDRAASTAVYRLVDTIQSRYAENSVKQAKKYFDKKILFDSALDLNSSDKLYCTELVWKSYLAAGIDLINSKFDYLKIPLKEGPYILPGTLINSPYLKQIVPNTQYKEEE